jgi:hypothetical protein
MIQAIQKSGSAQIPTAGGQIVNFDTIRYTTFDTNQLYQIDPSYAFWPFKASLYTIPVSNIVQIYNF